MSFDLSTNMWSDLVTPVQLTGYARARLEDYERQKWGSLVDYLPNTMLSDIVARFEVGATGLQPVAEFIGFDTETPLASLPGTQRVIIELPKLGIKMRVSEYDQIRSRGDLSQVVLLNSVQRITERLVDAISDRLEYERGYAIENAALAIDDETGFKQTGDWGRASEHEVTADVLWDEVDTSDPIGDLIDWQTQYIATNGFGPGSILCSTQTFLAMQRSESIRGLFATLVGAPSIVTREAVNQILGSYGLPPIRVYDRQVNLRGVVTKVLSPEYLFFLPAGAGTVGGVHLGATYWGATLEASEPEYNIEPLDRPGIVVGTWRTRDPIAIWVHSSAIGLAVLGDANLSLRAQVMPEGS